MNSSTAVIITAIICITVLEVVNLLTMKIDSNILSAVVGAIVFIATRQYYKQYHKRRR